MNEGEVKGDEIFAKLTLYQAWRRNIIPMVHPRFATPCGTYSHDKWIASPRTLREKPVVR